MAENEPNKGKRNRPTESQKAAGSFRSESTNLETGTTPKVDVNTSQFGGAGAHGEQGGTDFGKDERGGTEGEKRQRQGFNEGQGIQQGSRRTNERPEGRAGERKKREDQV